ncbi:hypothetical protein V6U90_12780 [Micromonospora sp. CPCC 206060]|uniref:hypothetical protein n=1 Tax=Micromonospora sp. CPCC 206060 TaxID=3122406 RepID=UPI002FF02C77
MTERDRPLEESPEVAAAVDDETTVPQLVTGGGPDAESPAFSEPGTSAGEFPPTEEIIGDPYGAGSPGGGSNIRTGGEQPWDPEDLAAARGQDPTPANVERARQDLAREGQAAVEKTVP